MKIIDWIKAELCPREVDSTKLLYDHMESQSDRWLPIVYQPFDIKSPSHWLDRGAIWDFYHSVGDGLLLDFGPGDGWPSLLLAPLVKEVIGVDASARRVAVCRDNARRLGLGNVEFVQVAAGEPLPFAAGMFDGITAASAVEQTPEPQTTLRELHRVLRPGGKLRITYEALGRYRGGSERELDLWALSERESILLIYDRDLARERVEQYALLVEADKASLEEVLASSLPVNGELEFDLQRLKRLEALVKESYVTTLQQPSGTTLQDWLRAAGFSQVEATENGIACALKLYDEVSDESRPRTLAQLDELLKEKVRQVVQQPAAIAGDPWLTATK